jgi:hypothetical protein
LDHKSLPLSVFGKRSGIVDGNRGHGTAYGRHRGVEQEHLQKWSADQETRGHASKGYSHEISLDKNVFQTVTLAKV